ncbi:MAG TPA: hypothetical protein H9732_04690 [Candidatus Mediterraneibacter avicola]|nr:hypothetical protein [Candidatus Mediterraneibacter avicola]
MGMLEFNFQKADSQIQRLEELAASIEELEKNSYTSTLQELSNAWKGAGADAYMRKAEKLRLKIHQAAVDLRQTAEVYRFAYAQVKAAEEFAAQIAVERK